MTKLKSKHIEIITAYIFLCIVVAVFSLCGVITPDNLSRYEITLGSTALFLSVSKLLGIRHKYKAVLGLCNVAFVLLCIDLYYTVAIIGYFIFIGCMFAVFNTAIIAYADYKLSGGK